MTQPNLNRLLIDLKVVHRQITQIEEHLPELLRRDEEQIGPDGWPSGGGGRSAKGDHSDPTSNAATARKQIDHVHEWTKDLVGELERASKSMNTAAGLVNVLRASVDDKLGRVNEVERCPVCEEPMPQPRAGMCENEYRRWVRAGRPERAPWINQQRKEREQAA